MPYGPISSASARSSAAHNTKLRTDQLGQRPQLCTQHRVTDQSARPAPAALRHTTQSYGPISSARPAALRHTTQSYGPISSASARSSEAHNTKLRTDQLGQRPQLCTQHKVTDRSARPAPAALRHTTQSYGPISSASARSSEAHNTKLRTDQLGQRLQLCSTQHKVTDQSARPAPAALRHTTQSYGLISSASARSSAHNTKLRTDQLGQRPQLCGTQHKVTDRSARPAPAALRHTTQSYGPISSASARSSEAHNTKLRTDQLGQRPQLCGTQHKVTDRSARPAPAALHTTQSYGPISSASARSSAAHNTELRTDQLGQRPQL